MNLKLTPTLRKHLGLQQLISKQPYKDSKTKKQPSIIPQPILEKNEYRLLAKMLAAINHQLNPEKLSLEKNIVLYQHPNKTLIFDDVNIEDDNQLMHLTPLTTMIQQPQLKRPVWEKLKTL